MSYALFSNVGIVPKISTLGQPFSQEMNSEKKTTTLFGNSNTDAERRRALALRTVEVRLQQDDVVCQTAAETVIVQVEPVKSSKD